MTEDTVEPQKLFIPGLAGLYQKFAPLSYALIRFSTGAVLFPHGVQKVFFGSTERYAQTIAAHGLPAPLLLTYATLFSEFVASACLALDSSPASRR